MFRTCLALAALIKYFIMYLTFNPGTVSVYVGAILIAFSKNGASDISGKIVCTFVFDSPAPFVSIGTKYQYLDAGIENGY